MLIRLLAEKAEEMDSFGKTISEARKSSGLSQKDLATRLGISAQYLNDIEHDRRSPSSDNMIKQLCQELGLKADVLYIAARTIPSDLSQAVNDAKPERVEEAMKAFRRALKAK